MAIEVREVQSRRDLKTFIYLPEKIHADQPNWLPPLYMDEWKYFDPAKNKTFSYCPTLRLLAWRDGRPVGRVMGIINSRFNEYRKEGSPGSATSRPGRSPKSSTPFSSGSRTGPAAWA